MDEGLFFLLCERQIVVECAYVWVCMPGGHASGAHDFAHHWRPARDFFVIGHVKGCYAAGLVTGDAFVSQNGRDLLGIRDLFVLRAVFARQGNQAAG